MKTIEEKAKECTEELERLIENPALGLYSVIKEHGGYTVYNHDSPLTSHVVDEEGRRNAMPFPVFRWSPPAFRIGPGDVAYMREVERLWRLLGLGIKND